MLIVRKEDNICVDFLTINSLSEAGNVPEIYGENP